jgi:hypothetical protein
MLGVLLSLLAASLPVNAQSGRCPNPDAVAKFTLDCARYTSETVSVCYRIGTGIYCGGESSASAPAGVAAPGAGAAAQASAAAVPTKAAAPAKK